MTTSRGTGGTPTRSSTGPSTGGSSSSAGPPILPPINRRSSTPLPGLSNTASSLRNRRASNVPTRSSLRRVHSTSLQEDDGEDLDDAGEDEKSNVDRNQLEELRKGIIMPGMGGTRANTESPGGMAGSSSTVLTRQAAATAALHQAAARDNASRETIGQFAKDTGIAGRGRLPATLKASILKGRHQPPSQPPAASSAKDTKGPSNAAKGTPARATRYSLPVRAEKPVRTSKTSGKHVMLPSESQLAPLPDEEDEEEEEEDDDDDDDSSTDETDTEEGKDADDEDMHKAGEVDEERYQEREAAKKRREEAQKSLEERREAKAAQRLARKPAGAPGYPSSARFRGIPTGAHAHALPPLKGPAHARAPPRRPKASGPAYHTFERLAPSARVHTPLPRLTSYAISPSIHVPTLIGFLRREHSVRPRLYDECVYVVYFKPLLPGFGRAEVRSAPEPAGASPGGESRREREIVEREESGYVGGYFAATNKDDEGDHIDNQGYIKGGEGEGEGEEQRQRQEDRGELTETETEREGGRKEDAERSAAEASESEAEVQGTSETEDARKSQEESYMGREMTVDEAADKYESGLMTPKALEPNRRLAIPDVLDLPGHMRESYGSQSSESGLPVGDEDISKADVQGAMDLQHQQFMIESGKSDDGLLPVPRHRDDASAYKAEKVEEDPHRRTSSKTDPTNGSHRRQQEDERRRRRRRENNSKTSRRKLNEPNTASHNHDTSANMLTSRPILEALQVAELIILPYGVLVMYNMSAAEERSVINDVISSGCVRAGLPYNQDDEETEAFHFCYDPTVPAPRIFNDFFTFRTSNHLLKLSLAHAIAQSTKLSVFEESMQRTLELTSHIPRELAYSGELKLRRREALKLTGRLFKLRVDVNLTSNVLDTPELFWSEASLKALYDAIREYLEIDQRVENLNERLAVGNDLLEVIHDHIGSQAMHQITWIIIILIVVACIVACGEITARLVLHARERSRNAAALDPEFELFKQLYYLSSRQSTGAESARQLLLD